MSKKKTHEIGLGFIKKMNIWVSILSVFVVLLICFTFFNLWLWVNGGVNIDKTNDATYINVIIAITGFLAAFSAISIYSIFNTNIDREKNNLEILTIDVKNLEKNLKNQITDKTRDLDEELKKQIAYFNKSDKDLNDYLNLIKCTSNLTSPYSIELKKGEAIGYFSTIEYVPDDIKKLILNFYKSLESKEEEKSKKYFQELRKLLDQWGMKD